MVFTRIGSLCLVLTWFGTAIVNAQDIPRNLVVALDQETAKLLPPQTVLGVLMNDGTEAYETVNARAWAMRHATYFVYQSGQESMLAAMYRERLQTQGIVVIELPRQRKWQQNANWLTAETIPPLAIPQVMLASHFWLPQK